VQLTFPIDPNSAVHHLSVLVDDREIVAEVKETVKAQKIYDDAVAAGDGAYLGRRDFRQADVYQIKVGNLPPGQRVAVTLKSVAEVTVETRQKLRVSLPVGLFTRYGADNGVYHDGRRIAASSQVIPVDLNVSFSMPSAIKSLSSPNPTPLNIAFGATSSMASIVSNLDSSVGDMVINVELTEPLKTTLYIGEAELNKETTAADATAASTITMTSVFPDLSQSYAAGADQLNEVVFVVDRSGSMTGQYIRSAGETLALCISSLPEGTPFQVCTPSYGSAYFNRY
jgi:von Willebrand factor A domain-containing protein 5